MPYEASPVDFTKCYRRVLQDIYWMKILCI
jgi:hypothetical protein